MDLVFFKTCSFPMTIWASGLSTSSFHIARWKSGFVNIQLSQGREEIDLNTFTRICREYSDSTQASDMATKSMLTHIAHIARERALSTKISYSKFKEIISACKMKRGNLLKLLNHVATHNASM